MKSCKDALNPVRRTFFPNLIPSQRCAFAPRVYFNVRLDEERTCVLVLIGATEEGTKELLAVVDGYRESTQSWRELLGQLKRQGLSAAPKLAIGEEFARLLDRFAGRIWPHRSTALLGA